MKWLIWLLLLALVVLHQDYWQWHRSDLVFGFVPYALAYHMGISIATACVWVLATFFCWPKDVDVVEKKVEQGDSA